MSGMLRFNKSRNSLLLCFDRFCRGVSGLACCPLAFTFWQAPQKSG
jgi:hypothetical protein